MTAPAENMMAERTASCGMVHTPGNVSGGTTNAPNVASTRINGEIQRRLPSPTTPMAATTR